MTENRLDKTISDVAYILDSLIALRNIQNTGNCNVCKNKDCKFEPKPGQMVRYNCPFYKAECGDAQHTDQQKNKDEDIAMAFQLGLLFGHADKAIEESKEKKE